MLKTQGFKKNGPETSGRCHNGFLYHLSHSLWLKRMYFPGLRWSLQLWGCERFILVCSTFMSGAGFLHRFSSLPLINFRHIFLDCTIYTDLREASCVKDCLRHAFSPSFFFSFFFFSIQESDLKMSSSVKICPGS